MKKYKLQFYKTANIFSRNRWRWRLKGGNGEIIDASTEGFYSKYNAKRNLILTSEALNTVILDGTMDEAYKDAKS